MEHSIFDTGKSNKYGAKKETVDGITFDSLKEGGRYRDLLLLKHVKGKDRVVEIVAHPKLSIDVEGMHICNYFPDFKVTYEDGRVEWEDVKGPKTKTLAVYRLKKKLVEAIYGIKIIEI